MLNPSIFLDFADAAYWDPRLTFSRASIGSYCDKLGVLRYRPNNTPRFWTKGADASPGGLLLEVADTNLALWSEDFTNAVWVATGATITPNASAAPDLNLTADTIAATATNANVAQTVPVTANFTIAFGLFCKASASNFVSLSLSDGVNVISAWFDLVNGKTGGTNLGAGTLTYQWASIQQWGNGWYRCVIEAASNTITSVTASVSPCAADRAQPAVGNSALIWGAMVVSASGYPTVRMVSYYPTTSAAATKAVDFCSLAYSRIDPSQFNPNAGTIFVDFMITPACWRNFATPGFGFGSDTSNNLQIGCAFGNNAGIGAKTMVVQSMLYIGSLTIVAYVPQYPVFDFEVPIKIATRYAAGQQLGQCVNGSALALSAAVQQSPVTMPTVFTLGPFGNYATPNATSSYLVRRWMYFPRFLSPDEMQQLTA
jgi:hypothetical protein